MFKIGLIINPVAGVGGRVGLKGSDGEEIQKLAFEKGAEKESEKKTRIALRELEPLKEELVFYTAPKMMGENLLQDMGFHYTVLGTVGDVTTPKNTEEVAQAMKEEGVELLVFAGGDGTARNIFSALDLRVPCLGVPAGVKIHSAVYANNPKSAGEAIFHYIQNKSNIRLIQSEVMDIDEELFRKDIVKAKLFGYLSVPQLKNLMQNPKAGAKTEDHDVAGIADELRDKMAEMPSDTTYVFGTGSTTYNIMKMLGYEGSLLGVDVVKNGNVILKDAAEPQLYETIDPGKTVLIVTLIGGQGHIFGRGNQQLSPRVIKSIGLDNIWIVSAANKLHDLCGRPLMVDTSDPELDREIAGYRKVIVGWQQ
ncbi:ATP-NAD kinase family protein, partial [Ruminococcaceae bacterium OttesenSCG-928-I18]|nr:ATP-NAD kinase family protein [Ruminococcaceae bacterium OttesenSCG-928-I18]